MFEKGRVLTDSFFFLRGENKAFNGKYTEEVIKMMTFIAVLLGVTLGTLLAYGLALLIVMNPKVMKAYLNWYHQRVEQICDEIYFKEDSN